MMKVVFAVSLLAALSAFAADLESFALERLSYELASAESADARGESVSAYLDTLDHLGLDAKSSKGCVSFALKGMTSDFCRSLSITARSSGGDGSGGAD